MSDSKLDATPSACRSVCIVRIGGPASKPNTCAAATLLKMVDTTSASGVVVNPTSEPGLLGRRVARRSGVEARLAGPDPVRDTLNPDAIEYSVPLLSFLSRDALHDLVKTKYKV